MSVAEAFWGRFLVGLVLVAALVAVGVWRVAVSLSRQRKRLTVLLKETDKGGKS